MKHLREVSVAGIIVASLATVPTTAAASVAPRASSQRPAQVNVMASRRAGDASAYQDRLTRLGAALESDIFELEFKLSRLSHGHDI